VPSSRRPPPLSRELRRLIDLAYRDREHDVRRIVADCRRVYPEYRALRGAALEGLRQNVRYLVSGFYEFNLIESRAPTLAELERTIANARARAAQGVSLHAMIGSFQLAVSTLWERLIATVGSHAGVRMELLQRVPITFASINRVTTVVTEAYLAERERLQRSRSDAIAEFLRLLVSPDAPLDTVEARARGLGLDLGTARVALQIRRDARRVRSAPDLEVVARLLAITEAPPDAIVGRADDGVLALLPRDDHQAVGAEVEAEFARFGWRIGVGSPAADTGGLRRSALEARRALELAALLRRPGAIHRYADFVLHDLVDVGSPRARAFAQNTLGTLTRGIYRETLRALCSHGFRLKPAAAALGVHPHTLSYRVKQLQRRHALDLGDAQTRLQVALALLILGS